MESVNEKMAREYARVKEKKMTLDTNRLQDMMRSGSVLPGVALAQDMPNVGRKKLTPPKKFIDYEGGAIDWSKGNIDLMSRMYPSVKITIDTPTQNQEIPSDEDVVVSFTVTTDTQNYIYAIALVVDGVEVEKRSPYSTADFTIDAGTLTEAAHTIRIRAYDTDDNQVFETPVRNITVTASFTYLLDEYPGAEIALDVFKLSSTYNGDCYRIRRDSDNAETDIGFVDNYIDTAAILSFAGAGSAYIVRRYDQSGNGNDTFINTEINQPMIVNNGTLVSVDGIAMADFDGADDYLATLSGLTFGTGARSVFSVQKADSINFDSIVNLSKTTSPNGASWSITPEVAVRTNSTVWVSSSPLSTTNISILSNVYTSGSLFSGNSMWVNSSPITRTSGSDGLIDTGNDVLTEGAYNPGTAHFNGKKGLLIAYKSDQTSNRTAIENIIMSNYGMV